MFNMSVPLTMHQRTIHDLTFIGCDK